MICSVLLVQQLSDMNLLLKKSYEQKIDMVEIRLDALSNINTEELKQELNKITIPYILSLRSEWLNIEINPPETGRIAFLKEIIKFKPPYISLEYPLDMPLLNLIHEETIPVISLVDFEGTAKIAFNTVLLIVEKNKKIVLKISVTPNHLNDLFQIWRWARMCIKKNIKHVILGLGSRGKITQIKSHELQNEWTYARLDLKMEEPQLPGMLPVERLKRGLVSQSSHFIGLGIEENIQMENIIDNILNTSSIPALFLFLKINNIPNLDRMLMWAKDNNIKGMYINNEWQEHVTNSLEFKDYSVAYTSRCDCILRVNDGWKGYYTPVYAIKHYIDQFKKRIRRIYIEGYELNIMSFLTALRNYDDLEIVIRTEDSGILEFLKQINDNVISVEDVFNPSYDIFINCRHPYKGFESVLPVGKNILENCVLIIDPLSNNATMSPLREYADKQNILFVNGWDVLIKSLATLGEIWLDESFPINLIRNIANKDIFDVEKYFT